MSEATEREAVRALFQRALDAELSPEENMTLAAALARDPELERELSALRSVLEAASALSQATPSVDLLGPVQQKLRARSGGRFYRDRFAEKQGRGPALVWALAGSAFVLLVTLLWLSFEAGLLQR